jgi:Methyltransferase small domain
MALLSLLEILRLRGYRFVTPTPATHRLVVGRSDRAEATRLTDILGWSLPFRKEVLDPEIETLLRDADAIQRVGDGLWKCAFRVSSLHGQLFLHSAYPTDGADAVFLGPDSYRFANLIAANLAARPLKWNALLVDMGAGAGVGAIVASKLCPGAQCVMTDVNPLAVRLARINSLAAATPACFVQGEGLGGVKGPIDLILVNPPYIVDEAQRAYRDGGARMGGAVALDMAREAVGQLADGGRFILYTGSAIVEGADLLGSELSALANVTGCSLTYGELDPDVFGEELASPAYRHVDRIAVVAAIFQR